MTHPTEFERVALADLVPYVPALAAGVRALEREEKTLRSRFEPAGAELVAEDAETLVELRRLIEAGGRGS